MTTQSFRSQSLHEHCCIGGKFVFRGCELEQGSLPGFFGTKITLVGGSRISEHRTRVPFANSGEMTIQSNQRPCTEWIRLDVQAAGIPHAF